MRNLDSLFEPSSVAIVGATDRSGSVGRAILENMDHAFTGKIHCVNPNRDSVGGYTCVDDLTAVSPLPDLVVVAVPAEAALEVIETAGELGIRNIVVISAGFGEAGEAGRKRERRLIALADEYNLNLIGPNCVGVIGTANGLNATFAPTPPPSGNIALMSQSGAFLTTVVDWAASHGLGFRDVVSLGNEAVIDETDLLEWWGAQRDVSVIVAYLEAIEDGQRFLEVASEVTRHTPVVVLKAGRTEAGAKAAASHTGSMAGSARAVRSAFQQAGVLEAETVEELLDVSRTLDGLPVSDDDRIAIVTNAGGPGVLATDALSKTPLQLASFTSETQATLETVLPAGVGTNNPLDVIGDAGIERIVGALEAVLDDETVDAVLFLASPTALIDFETLADEIVRCHQQASKPVVTCLMGGDRLNPAIDILETAGIPNYFDPARALRGLSALSTFRERSERPRVTPVQPNRCNIASVRSRIADALDAGQHQLGVESMAILEDIGIPTANGAVYSDSGAAQRMAAELGTSVVLKVVSPDIVHKSDVGAIAVDVAPDSVESRARSLLESVRTARPSATIEGIFVQPYIADDDAVEILLGGRQDNQFGALVLAGLGGIFTEIFEDTSLRLAPVAEETAREMLDALEGVEILRGARGRTPVDEGAIVEAIIRLSWLLEATPSIQELDINPLIATPDGVVAVDFRATLSSNEADSDSEVTQGFRAP